jgi:hypothetical protein
MITVLFKETWTQKTDNNYTNLNPRDKYNTNEMFQSHITLKRPVHVRDNSFFFLLMNKCYQCLQLQNNLL